MEYEVISEKMYKEAKRGASHMSGNLIDVIGEQLVKENGQVYDLYLYNIVGYKAQNGKPFVALKENICIF